MGQPNYQHDFTEVTTHERMLDAPLRLRKPHTIFVNSMSDLFHRDVPTDFIHEVFGVMEQASHHRFQVLTKRSGRLKTLEGQLPWRENIWMGVSVESAKYTHRIDDLRVTDAAVKFLSIEPLLGPIPNLNLQCIDWVIVGGESGPGARPMDPEWVVAIKEQCVASKVPFFFKQWGGTNKKRAGRTLEGRVWNQMPAVAL
jgi:protein gp37